MKRMKQHVAARQVEQWDLHLEEVDKMAIKHLELFLVMLLQFVIISTRILQAIRYDMISIFLKHPVKFGRKFLPNGKSNLNFFFASSV